jgi:hypothetical protein
MNKLHRLSNPYLFFDGLTVPSELKFPQCRGFTITPRHITLGGTPQDEWLARRSNPYLTTHKTHNGQTSLSGKIRTRNPCKRAAVVPRFRPRSHGDWHPKTIEHKRVISTMKSVWKTPFTELAWESISLTLKLQYQIS